MTVFYAVYYSRFTRVDNHGKFFWKIFLTFFVGKSTQNFLKINSSRTYFQNFVQRLEHFGIVFHTHTHTHTHYISTQRKWKLAIAKIAIGTQFSRICSFKQESGRRKLGYLETESNPQLGHNKLVNLLHNNNFIINLGQCGYQCRNLVGISIFRFLSVYMKKKNRRDYTKRLA